MYQALGPNQMRVNVDSFCCCVKAWSVECEEYSTVQYSRKGGEIEDEDGVTWRVGW